MLACLGAVSIFELLISSTPLWRWHRTLAGIVLVALSIICGLLVGKYFAFWSVMVLYFTVYRVINMLRVTEDRINAQNLRSTSKRTSAFLILYQLCFLGVVGLSHLLSLRSEFWWVSLIVGQSLCCAILLFSLRRQLKKIAPPLVMKNISDRDLPTLTVAIPARNETEDLEACLTSLINNSYPKLEILVLDDCSQVKRTPEIIRQFAHDGVRFIAGKVPPERWLAKNYAYEQLSKEANGEILLFCGVDARFQSGTLRLLVEAMIAKDKSMVSILPKNIASEDLKLESLLLQPARYAWELALPRRTLHRPPVLSTCWLIAKKALTHAGGFEAVSHSISPESYFARFCIKDRDGYSFMRSNDEIGLSCQKSVVEQRSTGVRTRYPQLHKRIELVSVLTLLEFSCLALPYALLVYGILTQHWVLLAISIVNIVILCFTYSKIITVTFQKTIAIGIWITPFAGIYDLALLNYSMWQYEFNAVIWKNRNVCVPVMQTFNKLPKLPT